MTRHCPASPVLHLDPSGKRLTAGMLKYSGAVTSYSYGVAPTDAIVDPTSGATQSGSSLLV